MINAIDLRTLRNGEFVQFGADFYGLVNANNPVALNIKPQLLAFKTKLDETTRLFKLERSSPITQDLILLDERRDKAINGLSSVIDSYCYHYDNDTANAANALANNLRLFGPSIAKLNFPTASATIDGIINDWETKPELIVALTKLGLTTWVEELKTANLLFELKYLERTKEYSAANPDTLKSKREEAMVAYYELRKYLEAYATIQNTPEYKKVISELNALIDQYNALINGRSKEVVTPPVVVEK